MSLGHDVKKNLTEPLWWVVFVFFSAVVLVFIFLNVFLVVEVFSNKHLIVGSDYPHYYSAGLMVRNGEGENLYNFEVNQKVQRSVIAPYRKSTVPARNPPATFLFFLPFSYLEIFTSYFSFAAVNIVFLVFISYLSMKFFPNLRRYILIYILAFAYYPNELSLIRGQVSILIAFMFLFFYYFSKSKPFFAGIIYSLLLIKPQFFFVGLPFFLVISKERTKFLKGMAISSIVMFMLSAITSGWNTLMNYPYFLFSTENPSFGSWVEVMFSLDGFFSYFTKWLKLSYIWKYVIQIVLYFCSFCLLLRSKRGLSFENLFISASIFTCVFAVHVLPYDLSFIYIVILILLNHAFSNKKNGNSLIAFFLATLIFLLPNLEIAGFYSSSSVLLFLISLYTLSGSSPSLRVHLGVKNKGHRD